jgi:hypothetical protein
LVNIFTAALLSPFKRFKKEPGAVVIFEKNGTLVPPYQKKGVMLVTSPLLNSTYGEATALSEDRAEIKLCTTKKSLQGNVL